MATEPLFYAGLLLLGVGVGVGVGIAVLRRMRGEAQALVVAAGVCLTGAGVMLVLAARDEHRFRVVDVELLNLPDYVGPCPAQRPVRAQVSTAGGDGRVASKVWADEDYDTPLRRVAVPSGASFEFRDSVRVPRSGLSTASLHVDAPNYKVATAFYEVRCNATSTDAGPSGL